MSAEPSKVIDRPVRSGTRLLNFLLLLGIIAAVGLFVRAEMQRRETTKRLETTQQELEEVKKSTEQNPQAQAQEILKKVRKHIDVAEAPEPTVATIFDVDKLRETSEFYKVAKNGDIVIFTTERAILYSPERDVVLDVVPVIPDPNASPAATGEARPDGRPVPTRAGSPVPSAATSAAPAASPVSSPLPTVAR